MFTLTGRLLWARWPTLLGWLAATQLAKYLLIQVAGILGVYTVLGGMAVLALAILVSLVGYVAMFRVLADDLATAEGAALPPTPRERRRAFLSGLLTAVIPYLVIYISAGQLQADYALYAAQALYQSRQVVEAGEPVELVGIPLGPLSVSILAAAFVGRWLYKRYQDRLAVWWAAAAAYLEVLWFFLAALILVDLQKVITAWVEQRQGVVWLDDARGWVGEQFAWALTAWDGVLWLVAFVVGIVVLPLTWLATAGVVMGRAYAVRKLAWARAPWARRRAVRRARGRWRALPAWLRGRSGDVKDIAVGRFAPLINAFTLMLRSGPAMIGVFVLGYVVIDGLDETVWWAVTRQRGPSTLADSALFFGVVSTAVMLVFEQVRVAYLAAATDSVRAVLEAREAREAEASGPSGKGEAQAGDVVAARVARGEADVEDGVR